MNILLPETPTFELLPLEDLKLPQNFHAINDELCSMLTGLAALPSLHPVVTNLAADAFHDVLLPGRKIKEIASRYRTEDLNGILSRCLQKKDFTDLLRIGSLWRVGLNMPTNIEYP